jgi:RNA polymerase subunit RPABC4/transcription elongation factor Spt4
MNTRPAPICGQHKTSKEWKPTTFEYSEDGITVRVVDIDAWVCPVDGEASFTPMTADELHQTVRESLEAAKQMKARQPASLPFVVTVTLGEQVKQAA